MDTSSFLLGIGLGILGAFGTGFLKKAGEDCYGYIKKKLNPKAVDQHAPQLIVQLVPNGANAPVDNSSSVRLKPASIERVSPLTFQDIAEAISSAPPLQRDHVAESFKGLRVEWGTYFRSGRFQSGSSSGDDAIRLRLGTEPRGSFNTITCEVLAKDYRELGVLPEGTKIRVFGEIESASRYDIELKDVRLHIYYERQ
jgi:hypothetical protein